MPALAPIVERTTAKYTATVQDEAGAAIPGASLTTLTFTLYDKSTGTIINSRDHVDVKSMVDVAGLLTLELKPADNVILDDSLGYEHHVALFEFTYGDDNRGTHVAALLVQNVSKVA